MWDWLSRRGRTQKSAKAAELAGDFLQAASLYIEANAGADAARVLLSAAEVECDPKARLLLYARARTIAPARSRELHHVTVSRARYLLLLAPPGVLSPTQRFDLDAAGTDLESIGEHALAAQLYERLGDRNKLEDALEHAGDVDKLAALVREDNISTHEHAHLDRLRSRVNALVDSGLRRDALSLLLQEPRPSLMEQRQRLENDRCLAEQVALEWNGKMRALCFTDELIIGRTDGHVCVPHRAVSHRHGVVRSRPNTGIAYEDAASRNGTYYRGLRLSAPLPITERMELTLGGEVPLSIEPTEEGLWKIEVSSRVIYAAFSSWAPKAVGWSFQRGTDGWLEVHSNADPIFLVTEMGHLELASIVTPLIGDRLARARGGPIVALVRSPS